MFFPISLKVLSKISHENSPGLMEKNESKNDGEKKQKNVKPPRLKKYSIFCNYLQQLYYMYLNQPIVEMANYLL